MARRAPWQNIVTPWESRRLKWKWNNRAKMERTESSDEEEDESWEEEGGPRQSTPWAPRWSIGAPRFPGMPQWPPTIDEEQTVCALTATFVQPAQLVRTSQSKISVQCHSTNYARAGCETPCPG